MKGIFPTAVVISLLILAALSAPLFAGWTVTILTPPRCTYAYAHGVSGGQQVGQADGHAGLWNGAASSWVDLNPTGCPYSAAVSADGNHQVGYGSWGGGDHAILWSGTAASWVDLNPGGCATSDALGVSGDQQVGVAAVGGNWHASLWSGTAGSWVDLNPTGCTASEAHGVFGGQQVGNALVGGNSHACLWSGSPAEWVDLNPAGCTVSGAIGTSGTQQVGSAWGSATGQAQHASLWSGTASSWVDLNPAGCTGSMAYGISGGRQVGFAWGSATGGTLHASLWNGTASSWVDLASFLPAGYTDSEADGIWTSCGVTKVIGYANKAGGGSDAVLWTFSEWTVTILTPPGCFSSVAFGASGTQQVGYVDSHASLWNGSASSWVDLLPAGHNMSWALGVSGTDQVGCVDNHASLWSGSAASWVDLNPMGEGGSEARGVSDGQQVGMAWGSMTNWHDHAMLWSGSASSYVDLNPPGYTSSDASGISDGQQVGTARGSITGGYYHATLWSGSASSVVDLNPAGCTGSMAYAVSGGQQVGSASYDSGATQHAGLWNGSAASWVDLHPAGFTSSEAYGVSGGQQAGYGSGAATGGYRHAMLWTGSASSCVDLTSLLPEGYTDSWAGGISVTEGVTRVVGCAQGTQQNNDAVLWTYDGRPTIDSFLPTSGPVTTPVQIHGAYFLEASEVKFNGTSAVFGVDSDFQITADVPVGATVGPISVTTPAGTGVSADIFTPITPSNDTSDDATNITDVGSGETITEDTTHATTPGDIKPSCVSDFGKGVWFRYDAVGPGDTHILSITTSGSDFDTGIGIFCTKPDGSLEETLCNDDANAEKSRGTGRWQVSDSPDGTSELTDFYVPAGTTIWILAGGKNGESGDLKLTVNAQATAPGGTDLGNVNLTGSHYSTGSHNVNIEIAGATPKTEYGQISLAGPCTLVQSTLNATFPNAGFELSPAQSFEVIVVNGTISGEFLAKNFPPKNGLRFDTAIVTDRIWQKYVIHPASTAPPAGWAVSVLTPPGCTGSYAYDVSGSQQMGYAYGLWGQNSHAILWNGSASSWVDLNPAGCTGSEVSGASVAQQVGCGYGSATGSSQHAILWSGSASEWVDLHPSGCAYSAALGAWGTQQVGSVGLPDESDHASLWSGKASSWVDLNPAGSTSSVASATSGTQQVGWAASPDSHASLWSGRASSWADLNPAGCSKSEACDISGNQQVGWASGTATGEVNHASLWRGSASSWWDLNPAGCRSSYAYGTSGDQQVGWASGTATGEVNHASLWSGSAASWVDLGSMLPPGYASSCAYSTSTTGGVTRVVGYATNAQQNTDAILWTRVAGSDNMGDIRGVASGSVACQGVVTAKFESSMFVESSDRSVGVKVTQAPLNVSVGDRVLVVGDVSVVGGMKQVAPTSTVSVVSSGNPLPELGMRCRDVGGVSYGPNDPGVTHGRGPLNVGLLVTVQGMVTYRDTSESPTFFYVWDGSNMYIPGESDPRPLDDGSGHVGVRVSGSGVVDPWKDFVTVNGIVGVNQTAIPGSTIPQILPKSVGVVTHFDTVNGDSMMNDPFMDPNAGDPMNDSIGKSLVQGANLWGCPAQPAGTGDGTEPVWDPYGATNPMPWWPSVVFSPNDTTATGDNQIYRWENGNQSQILYDIWAPDAMGGIVEDDGYWLFLAAGDWSLDPGFSGIYPTIPQWYAVPRVGALWMGNPQNHDVNLESIQIHDGGSVKSYRDADQDGAGWITSQGYWWNNGIQSQAMVDLWDRWPDGGNGLRAWHGYTFDAPTADKAWIIP